MHRSSFESKILTAFSAAMLVVVALAVGVWLAGKSATLASDWVMHTHLVLNNLAHTKADTLQIELATKTFRMVGDPAQLVERNAAVEDREKLLQQIKELVADRPEQMARWTQLRQLATQRLDISRRVEWLRKNQGEAAANAFAASVAATLDSTRERTYQILHAMEIEEHLLLESRTKRLTQARQVLLAVGVLMVLFLLALLVATYILIRRQLREKDTSARALADNEESLATTLHSIGDAVLSTDIEGRITRMNLVAERLTGWPLMLVQGRPVDAVLRIIHERSREPIELPVAAVLASGEVRGLANHALLVARDGRECPVADSAAPIRDSTGQMRGVVLVFRDVTIERQAEMVIQQQNILLEQRVQERTAQLRDSEDHLRSVISNVPALIAYVDAQQRYVYVNQTYHDRFAPDRLDIAGRTVREILGEARYAIASPMIAKALQGQPQGFDWEPFPGVWQAINYVPQRDSQGLVVGYYVMGTDITERKHAEDKIQALNHALEQHVRDLEHVSRALRTLSAGNRAMLRASSESGLLTSMCQGIVRAGGYAMAVVWFRQKNTSPVLLPMSESGYPGGMEALRQQCLSWSDAQWQDGVAAAAIRSNEMCVVHDRDQNMEHPWQLELAPYVSGLACPLCVDGEVIGALAIYDVEPNTFDADEMTLLAESAADLAFGISTLRARADQQRAQEAVYQLTRYDAVTGLPNEMQFTELLSATIGMNQTFNRPFALLQTSIERLSEINDALGFGYGDQVLREFGARLRQAAPEFALIARLRANEFALLLPGCDALAALRVVEKLEESFLQPFHITDIPLDVPAKIGVALFPTHGTTPHELFQHMDTAMHQAKKVGVGHVFYNPEQNRGQSHRLALASELRRAVEGGDLLLYLQPKVEMLSGRVCGAEGLVRWQHAERGLIPPYEFIGLAEQTGLIKPLTEWVIETALHLNHDWEREGRALPIAINLSARNFRDEHLLERIHHLQSVWTTSAGLFEVEITESAVMDNAEFALRVLHSLHDEGIPLYIDDFGTGYSSLSYLQKLPVDYIKIDQSFVFDMATNKDSALIVRSTIDLVHDLGRKIVAEGVETQDSWVQLAHLGCDTAQGYLIAKPMPSQNFQAWWQQYQPFKP